VERQKFPSYQLGKRIRHPNEWDSVDLEETRIGSREGFRRIAKQTETLGEFRYVKSMPFLMGG